MKELYQSKYEACPHLRKYEACPLVSKYEACPLISKYEAYPFLSDASDDLRCDFEILTDEIASLVGLLRGMVSCEDLRDELRFVCETIYHINPSLRTHTSVTQEELRRLDQIVQRLQGEMQGSPSFVLPVGCESGAMAHVIRVKCKACVRLLYRYHGTGQDVDPLVLDFMNLFSGYFFFLALYLNAQSGTAELPYISRNYGVKTREETC